jgi:hypothetical protein
MSVHTPSLGRLSTFEVEAVMRTRSRHLVFSAADRLSEIADQGEVDGATMLALVTALTGYVDVIERLDRPGGHFDDTAWGELRVVLQTLLDEVRPGATILDATAETSNALVGG